MNCWKLESRTTRKYDEHQDHFFKTPADYAGSSIEDTRTKFLSCAQGNNYLKEETILELLMEKPEKKKIFSKKPAESTAKEQSSTQKIDEELPVTQSNLKRILQPFMQLAPQIFHNPYNPYLYSPNQMPSIPSMMPKFLNSVPECNSIAKSTTNDTLNGKFNESFLSSKL